MTLKYDYVEQILRTIEEDRLCKASDYVLRQDLNKIVLDIQQLAVEEECCPGSECRYWDRCSDLANE